MRRQVLAAAMSLLIPACACADGLMVSWGSCTSGSTLRTSACNSNTGTHDIVAGIVAPAGLTAVTGAIGIIDLCLGGVPLPPWWQLGSGGCRPAALSAVSADLDSPRICANYWGDRGTTVVNYQVGYSGWDSARILVYISIDPQHAGPLNPDYLYHMFRVRIDRSNTTGTDACYGCFFPACIVLNEIQLLQPEGTPGGSPRITQPLDGINYLMWQGNVGGCPYVVPTKNQTWGQIKSLYR